VFAVRRVKNKQQKTGEPMTKKLKMDAVAPTNGTHTSAPVAPVFDEEELEPFEASTLEETLELNDEMKIDATIRMFQGGGHHFKLMRKKSTDSGYVHMGKFPADDFDIETIRLQFGGGRYSAQAINPRGHYGRKFEFAIDEIFQGRAATVTNTSDPAELARVVAGIVKNSTPTDSSAMVNMMEKQSEQGKNFMVLMMQMQAESTKTMMGLMTAIMSRPDPAPRVQSGGDFSNAITPILIKMIESSSQKSNGLDVKGLIELRDFLTPDREEKEEKSIGSTIIDALVSAAPAVLPMFLPHLQQPKQAVPSGFQQLPSGGVSPIPPTQPAAVTPCPLTPDGSPTPEVKPRLELMPMLKRGAKMETDPESYAFVIADMVGDAGYPELLALLQRAEWKTLFTGFTAVEMEWVAAWRECVLHLDDTEEVEPVEVINVQPQNAPPNPKDSAGK